MMSHDFDQKKQKKQTVFNLSLREGNEIIFKTKHYLTVNV